MTPPCKGCEERTAECHGTCERYGAWAEERQRVNEQKNKEKKLREYYIELGHKIRKRGRDERNPSIRSKKR